MGRRTFAERDWERRTGREGPSERERVVSRRRVVGGQKRLSNSPSNYSKIAKKKRPKLRWAKSPIANR